MSFHVIVPAMAKESSKGRDSKIHVAGKCGCSWVAITIIIGTILVWVKGIWSLLINIGIVVGTRMRQWWLLLCLDLSLGKGSMIKCRWRIRTVRRKRWRVGTNASPKALWKLLLLLLLLLITKRLGSSTGSPCSCKSSRRRWCYRCILKVT